MYRLRCSSSGPLRDDADAAFALVGVDASAAVLRRPRNARFSSRVRQIFGPPDAEPPADLTDQSFASARSAPRAGILPTRAAGHQRYAGRLGRGLIRRRGDRCEQHNSAERQQSPTHTSASTSRSEAKCCVDELPATTGRRIDARSAIIHPRIHEVGRSGQARRHHRAAPRSL